ncbi:hypothetical protein DMH04_12940 [Kibdelosporangium aridum]|uniref:Uncharacterized protein n=1 Tax=Kibdelosporangium aridum TaxID=2030 RepID=A0A428ZES7_KIBAR|nr:hypothetical protein [Kibdelosporangium aridum]RSM86555.1 hypothetical protein DMH04_12940 [Kibdelosporangium aridum]
MKWLLWAQLVVVLAALAVGALAIFMQPAGVVVAMGIGLAPIVLIVGAVMGLIALKRRKGYVHAGIVQLVPAVFAVASALTPAGEDVGWSGYLPLNMADQITRTLQWLTASMWLIAAATVLAVVSALLLFRRKEN